MNPLVIERSTQFKKDFKRCERRKLDTSKLETVIEKLVNRQPLETRYKDHDLHGDWEGVRECHVTPDWLLAYFVEDDTLYLVRTGSHSDLGF